MTHPETAAERWARQMAGWAIPAEILDGAPRQPFVFTPRMFAAPEPGMFVLSLSNRRAAEALGDGGSVLDVGRRRRTVDWRLRKALEVRDGGCRFPGCGSRYTQAHHAIPWAEGGETALDNLILVCHFHHRTVHERGWRVKMDPSQVDQILANLCVNARDAIDGAGRVVIETAGEVVFRVDRMGGMPRGNDILIPPNSYKVLQGVHTLDRPALIQSFRPHMHTRGKEMSVEALYPDGRREMLGKIDNYRHNWQITYLIEEGAQPLLPRGTTLLFTSVFDNTAANEINPDPNQWVVFGRRGVDEMSHMWVGISYLAEEQYRMLLAER